LSHSTAGYLTYAGFTQKQAFSYFDPNDVFGCVADIGWITGKVSILKVAKFQKQIFLFSFPPITKFFSALKM
jgi:acyl-coenzyme A synthetase/AMP-(fatty) acid ligase